MKVGIVTHYYKSENYGGNLQAYALCKTIEGLGHKAEQISLDRSKDKGFVYSIKRLIKSILKSNTKNKSNFRKRKKAFLSFNQGLIPHSQVYSEKTISQSTTEYDAFITGSDQVWHPIAVCDAYLLKFVPNSKVKLSYAASIAHNELNQKSRDRYKEALADYKAISVRENEAVSLISPLTEKKVEVVLDPTLLLSKEEWLELSEPAGMNERYLFCYFLGGDVKERKIAEQYAKKHGLKIVTLPNLLGKTRECDKDFGDYLLYDVSPRRLIGLINEAECIFTDSFHATAFSLLCQKEHFVFQRSEHESMSSRIYTLADMFDTRAHFCDTEEKKSLEYIENCNKIDYSKDSEKYLNLKRKSLEFLKNNL